jgi:ubiquinone/menaquinone biosynthesis C-methylase UbiE
VSHNQPSKVINIGMKLADFESLAGKYVFEERTHCEMCGDPVAHHKVMGQRLNQSQGRNPKNKSGIAVSIMKCRNCKLIYAQPLPIPQDFNDHYGREPEDYWPKQDFEWHEGYFSSEIKSAKKLLPFQPGMKALDVGAGIGKCMVSLSKAGFDTYGFEPSRQFYERALSEMPISLDRLQHGMIEKVNYPDSSFDFITFGAVLEHLYHPADCLEKAMRWLKPGGLLHVEVPSSKYLVARIFNIYNRLHGTHYVTNLSPMHVPFHLYEFDVKSFTELGKRLHFKVEQHTIEVCEIMHIPRLFRPMLRAYMGWTNTGMQLTLFLRK